MTPSPGARRSRLPRAGAGSAPGIGLSVGVLLVALAIAIPAVTGWNVHVFSFPPLHADWDPRVGPGTVPAILVGALAIWQAARLAERVRWPVLLLGAFVAALAWLLALAFVDGSNGIGQSLDSHYEYLRTARHLTDFPAALHEWIGKITYAAYPHNWPVHVAGHPPGATFFFYVLVKHGFSTGYQAGMVVTVIAATTPVAVLLTMRALGAERHARRAAPFLAFGPAAIWSAVSADAVFAAVAAWGIAALAVAGTRGRWPGRIAWSVVAGALLGYGVMMSYGLPIVGVLALAVLWLARSWWPLPITALAALGVVLVFAAYGFDYLHALPAIHTRYWEGVASRRPEAYWAWGNLAALVISAGPLVAAGVGVVVARGRSLVREPATRVAATLALGGVLMVLVADASLMSKAEVERIWLPFEPWLLVSCALLPSRWRRWGLVLQVVFALLVQHLLATGW